MGSFEDLIKQIDAFIRKYYTNQMIRGASLFVLIFLISFLTVSGLEYIGKFSTTVRAILFFSFVSVNVYVLLFYFAIPLSKLFSFGKRINRYQAADIIGRFFPQVNDRLLNTLQLNDAMVSTDQYANIELLRASVRQNANKLSVFSFPTAINYKENSKYLRYLFPLLLTFAGIAWFVPSLFKEGTKRLVNYNEVFPDIAPFDFLLMNESLNAEEGTNYIVEVKLIPKVGGSLPDKLYIESSDGTFLMNKEGKNKFTFELPKLRSDVRFNFLGSGFKSDAYVVNVSGRSSIGKMTAYLTYPAYLQRSNERIENAGDLTVPEGTTIEWSGVAKNTKFINFVLPDSVHNFSRDGFKVKKYVRNNLSYQILLSNNYMDKVDTLTHRVEVIRDEFPSIRIEEFVDTTLLKRRFFNGEVGDDHGLRMVSFTYEIKGKEGVKETKTLQVPGISGTNSEFSMNFDMGRLPLSLEDVVTYFFTVYDNDGVNGSKSTRSSTFTYQVPSAQELNERRNEEKEKAIEELSELLNQAKEFNISFDRLRKDLSNTKTTSWKEKQQLEQLMNQFNSIDKQMEQLKEKMQNSFEEKQMLTPMEQDLLDKQKELEKLLEDLMDDELRELLEQLQEMMMNQDKDQMQDAMEEMEIKNEDMSRQLDRTMEMLKRMDVEERIQDVSKELNQLAEKQEELKDKIQNNEISSQEAADEQKKLQEEFRKVEENIDELMEKNEELKRPMNLDDLKEDRKDVNDNMEKAKDKMEKNNAKKSGEEQKKSSDGMKSMAQKMESMAAKSKQEQQGEDIEALKRLLKSLIGLSFSQEDIMDGFTQTSTMNPKWIQYGKEQRSIMDNTKPVEDSLRAIADRQPKISTFVNKELATINLNYFHLTDDIDERRKRELGIKQQYVMTAFNNLALFLNEALEQMQQEMQSMMPGSGSCDNPGGKGQGSEGEMDGIKDALKKQLEQMQKGSQEGGSKPGDKPGLLPMNPQQAAQMAAQQKMMQSKLEEMRKQMNKDGKGSGNHLNELLKELEDQQKDLINKKWDETLINRQKEILTRLLESEKAMQERGFDEQRESKTGKDENLGNQIEFLEYKQRKEKQIELLRTLDPTFNKYYRDRANEYYNRIY
jgi:hypothetical protein